jgi:hypothetical protein
MKRVPRFGMDLEEMKAAGRKYFGGRDMMPVRVVVGTGGEQFTFQLESISDAMPGPAIFTLPEGLEPFPLEVLEGMIRSQMPAEPSET